MEAEMETWKQGVMEGEMQLDTEFPHLRAIMFIGIQREQVRVVKIV